MEKDNIISRLEKMGLSNYEARAYLAALNQPPITGYKLSQLSGVPRSRIYETIEKLISKGLLVFQSGEKNFVAPLDFKTFLNRIERENSESIKYLREKLPKVNQHDDKGVWSISGREQIFEIVGDMILGARKYVYVEMSGNDIPLIKQSVQNSQKKNIQVWGIYCGESKVQIKNFFPHLGDSCATCTEIALCVDGKHALIGSTWPVDTATAALTQNNGFVYITEQYIKHEVFLHLLYAGKDKQAIKSYTKKYQDIMNQLP
jgi:predicted transcriptional regulator